MTSAINFTSIDIEYPVAGQDNDSQGFRDNFSAISAALAKAKEEITELHTKAVLVQELSPSTADKNNDLQGSTLRNGVYIQLNGKVRNAGTVAGQSDIDVNNGPLHVFTLSADTTLRFTNWPDNGEYSVVRVHLKSNTLNPFTATLATESGGTIKLETPAPSLLLSSNGKFKIIEAWTFDGGANVFVKYLGEF